jgi:hypothetical protein
MCSVCDNCLGKLTQGTILIFQDETSYDVENWKAIAAIHGVEYCGEGENAVMALRRALSKSEVLPCDLGWR